MRVLAVIVLVTASCGSESATPTSLAPDTEASTTTTEQTTTTIAATTTTTDDKEPTEPCAAEAALDTFGPLGDVPALSITLPLGTSPEFGAIAPWISVERIPGGLLIASGAYDYPYFEGSMLAAVDINGAIRWVTPYDTRVLQTIVAPAATCPTSALVSFETRHEDGTESVAWQTVDLETGEMLQSLDDIVANSSGNDMNRDRWAWAVSPEYALLGPPQSPGGPSNLLLIDLRGDSDEVGLHGQMIPFPDEFAVTMYGYGFEFTDAGDLALVSRHNPNLPTPVSVYHDGEWTHDPAFLEVPPIRPGLDFEGAYPTLAGFDAHGAEVWRVADVMFPGIEATPFVTSGNVSVMLGCPPDDCISTAENVFPFHLYGIDNSNGERLWELEELHFILAAADGYALVTGDDTRALIDTNTGEILQQWSANSYHQGCCDEYVYWAGLLGGVFVAVNEEQLDVWYPADVAPATTQTVNIP